MAKYGLVIGVANYQDSNISTIENAINDANEIERLLKDPIFGNFQEEDVVKLEDPTSLEIARAVHEVFSISRPDDLLFFYYSGHGIKDQNQDLYLAAFETELDDQGYLVPPTAYLAETLRSSMNKSRSKYQVVVLDCCFSGAFGRGTLSKGIGEIGIKESLGGRGRAILTSSSFSEMSFQNEGEDLSIYTKYFIEGVRTGAADFDCDRRITADEIHTYVENKVRENHKGMSPKIYPTEEGYKIFLFGTLQQPPIEWIDPTEPGLILQGNVVEFSELRGKDQEAVVHRLWNFIMNSRLLGLYSEQNISRGRGVNLMGFDFTISRSSSERANGERANKVWLTSAKPVTDGALDRFILALPLPRISHSDMLDFSLSIIAYMHEGNPSVDLKISVHEGRFQRITRPESSSTHLIGSGPNECTRMARIGDANNIILSEEFVKSWSKEEGNDVYLNVKPSDPEAPIEYFPKPGHLQRIYLYNPQKRNPHLSDKVPSRLANLQVAKKHLGETILQIDEAFVDLIQDLDESLSWHSIRPRTTILAPDPTDLNALISTHFRYIRERDLDDPNGNRLRKGPTVYRLENEAQGLPGKAFKQRPAKSVALNDLPDYHQNPDEYIRIMGDWGLSAEQIKGFGRFSRAVLAFPFGLSADDGPDGVVCIDTASSLSTISLADLASTGELLRDNYDLLIAALWNLRV